MNESPPRQKDASPRSLRLLRARGIVSTVLIVSCAIATATGGVLYFLPGGMWLGMSRRFLYDLHGIAALVMVVAAVVHMLLNRKLYRKEMRSLRKKPPGKKPPGA